MKSFKVQKILFVTNFKVQRVEDKNFQSQEAWLKSNLETFYVG